MSRIRKEIINVPVGTLRLSQNTAKTDTQVLLPFIVGVIIVVSIANLQEEKFHEIFWNNIHTNKTKRRGCCCLHCPGRQNVESWLKVHCVI